jgi:hypothetical protein
MTRPWTTKECYATKKRNGSYIYYEVKILYIRRLEGVGSCRFSVLSNQGW